MSTAQTKPRHTIGGLLAHLEGQSLELVDGRLVERGYGMGGALTAGREGIAIIDSGFNGDLKLHSELRTELNPIEFGTIESTLAGGQQHIEESFFVNFPIGGKIVRALATFVPGEENLVGTRLFGNDILTIDFPARTIHIERAAQV